VKEALGRFGEVPTIDFDTQGAPEIPAYSTQQPVKSPQIEVDPTYNPFNTSRQRTYTSQPTTNWEELYANFERNRRKGIDQAASSGDTDAAQPDQPPVAAPTEASGTDEAPTLPLGDLQSVYLQLKGRYILSPVKSGLMIIDQHRAHVRILFDRYINRLSGGTMSSQTILFPEVIHLSPAQSVTLQGLMPEMEKMGFVSRSPWRGRQPYPWDAP